MQPRYGCATAAAAVLGAATQPRRRSGLAALTCCLRRHAAGHQRHRGAAELGGLGRQAAALVDALRATTWRGRVLAAAAASATPDWRAKVEFLESVGLRPVERFGLAVVAERAAAYRPRPARSRAAGAGAGPRRVGLGGGGMGSEAVWVATQAGGREAAGSSMPTLQLKPVDSAARVGPITGHVSGTGGGSSGSRSCGSSSNGGSSRGSSASPRRAAAAAAEAAAPRSSGDGVVTAAAVRAAPRLTTP